MKELMKLMEKKKSGKPMDEGYKKAKMTMLQALKDDMSGMMGNEMKGMKKVTVAAPDEEGLKEGLNKAEELMEGKEELAKDDMEMDEEMSPEECDAMIKMLEKKKADMMLKKA